MKSEPKAGFVIGSWGNGSIRIIRLIEPLRDEPELTVILDGIAFLNGAST